MKKRTYTIPPIAKEVKEKFLKQVLLSPDDIQQSVEFDKTFQHDSLQKILLRGFIEWQRSECEEHHKGIRRENCSRCRRIAWESLK
jgi:predicted transcriptional regulator